METKVPDIHLFNPATKCPSQISTDPVMEWQVTATVILLAIQVTSESNPGGVLSDQELYATQWQLKVTQANQFP